MSVDFYSTHSWSAEKYLEGGRIFVVKCKICGAIAFRWEDGDVWHMLELYGKLTCNELVIRSVLK